MPTVREAVALIAFLIGFSLLLRNWQGANTLFTTGLSGTNGIIKTLES
jgi:hypothetical protein